MITINVYESQGLALESFIRVSGAGCIRVLNDVQMSGFS